MLLFYRYYTGNLNAFDRLTNLRVFIFTAATIVSEVLPRLGSQNLDLVVDCYEHAITATFPRGRYMPGYDSKYIYYALSLLPEWLSDWLLVMGSRIKLPPPTGARRVKQR
jgi:hypothetical protein